MATNVGSAIQDCPLKKEKNPSVEQGNDKLDISFNIENEFSEAVPNVTVKVTLSDKTVKSKTSDKNGLVVIENVTPGPCTIELNWDDVEKNRRKS